MTKKEQTEVQVFLRAQSDRGNAACRGGAAFAVQYKTLAKVWDSCERSDWLWWMFRAHGPIAKKLSVTVAIALAEHVLDIYESHPRSDDRPRNAIWAAREYLRSPSAKTKKLAQAAANDATNAATAAYTAADAAYAAYAADAAYADDAYDDAYDDVYDDAYAANAANANAAYAAADAANAAYTTYVADAVYAADAAYAAADATGRKWQADTIRILVGTNPFA